MDLHTTGHRWAVRLRIWLLGLGGLVALAVASLAGPAAALPLPCDADCTSGSPPPPTVTTIYSVSPGYGWSGDSVHINGYDLLAASVAISSADTGVSFDGSPTITSDSNSDLWFTLPTIHSTTAGAVILTFHVTTPKGAASTSFTLSPALHTSGYQTFMNSGGGQDGAAWASADVNRATGTVTEWARVENDQFWTSLSVNISVVWLDAQNRVIGFTDPQNVTVAGNYTLIGQPWLTPPNTAQGPLGSTVIGPNPGAGPLIHSAQIVLERDHLQELINTLTTAFQNAQTIDFLWSHLPH